MMDEHEMDQRDQERAMASAVNHIHIGLEALYAIGLTDTQVRDVVLHTLDEASLDQRVDPRAVDMGDPQAT